MPARALIPGSPGAGDSPRQARGRGWGPGQGSRGIYQHRVEMPVRRGSPGVQKRAPRLAGAWPTLSSSCMAESKACGGVGAPCQHWEHWTHPPPSDPPPPRGPVRGQGEGLRVGLTSVVSVPSTTLFLLMAATLRSSRRPRSSLPVMRSHRADSASHLPGFRGGNGRGPCLWPPGPGLHEPHCPSVSCPRGLASLVPTGPRLRKATPFDTLLPQQATLSAFFLLPLGLCLGGPVLPFLPPSRPGGLSLASLGSQAQVTPCAVRTPQWLWDGRPPRVPSCLAPPCCHTVFLLTLKAAPSCLSGLLPQGPSLQTASHPAGSLVLTSPAPSTCTQSTTNSCHFQYPLHLTRPTALASLLTLLPMPGC